MHPDIALGILHAKYNKLRGTAAVEHLHSLLTDAACRLLDLGREPLCLLDAPWSLDKPHRNWRAVRVGPDAFHTFDARKRTSSRPIEQWAQAKEPLRKAHDVLQSLIDGQWRPLFFEAFDFHKSWSSVTSLALLVDFDEVFLAAESDGVGEPVYKLERPHGFSLAGVSRKLTTDLSGARPFEWITTEQWAEEWARIS